MSTTDPLADRILRFLGDRYLPVQTDWIETPRIAAALHVEAERVDARCRILAERGLIELSAPDDENATYAALITTKGLLAIGRVP
jgi:hypothetical protein